MTQPADAFYPPTAVPRFAWPQRVEHWLHRLWQAECRRAECPDRVVPYY